MTWHMEENFSILLMRSVTNLAHFSRSSSSFANALGKLVEGFAHIFGTCFDGGYHFGTSS
jgi:hypothetical protein